MISMAPADTARYRQIADDIRERIESGELPPGWTFPGELTLAEKHGVARGTITRAFDALRAEGLVETIAGRGTQVRHRGAVREIPSGRYRAGWGDALGTYEIDHTRATAEVAQVLEVDVDTALLRQRSVHLAGDRPWRIVTSHIPLRLVEGREAAFGAARAGDNVEQLAEVGVRVDEVVEAVSSWTATEEEAQALAIPPGSRTMVIDRVMRAGGLPVETASIVMPADQVRLTTRITL